MSENEIRVLYVQPGKYPEERTIPNTYEARQELVGETLDTRHQRRKVKDFFIKFKKKSHFADFLTEQTLDFVLHRLFCGLAEMDTDDIGCLADLLSDSRARGAVGCGIVHSKSSCK